MILTRGTIGDLDDGEPPTLPLTDIDPPNSSDPVDHEYAGGIATFAFTVRHEAQHLEDHPFDDDYESTDDDGYIGFDQDNDGLSNDLENDQPTPILPDDAVRNYEKGDPISHADEWGYDSSWGQDHYPGYDDTEDAVLWQQVWPGDHEYDDEDWAKNRAQWGDRYTSY